MASPFEIFRKNQRILMAGAVLLAMFAFVIAPMFDTMRGGSGGAGSRSNPIIAAWKGGAISNEQAQMDGLDLQIANRFLSELARAVMQKGGMPQVPDFRPDLTSLGITQDVDIRMAAFRRMLITEAQNMGIRFDDESVKVFLEKFVNGKLGGEAIVAILKQSTERRMSMTYFNRVMRDELAFQHVLRLANAGMFFQDLRDSRSIAEPVLVSPSKNWREFLKLRKEAKIQAYPIYVKDLLAEVTTTPSDKELKDLYAKGKDIVRTVSTLDSEPAFMTPPKADIEFLTIDTEAVIVAEMAKIPEEELRKEYERRVADKQFQVPIEAPKSDTTELPLPETTPVTPTETPATAGDAPANAPATTEPPAQAPPTTEPTASTPPATEPPATTPPATEPPATTPPATTPPATEPPATEPPATEPPATEPPATEPPATEPPATEPPATEPPVGSGDGPGKQSSLQLSRDSVRLVSYQEPATQPPAVEPPATQPPVLEPPATQPPPATDPVTAPPADPANPLRNETTATPVPPPADETKPVTDVTPVAAPATEAMPTQAEGTNPVLPGLSIGDQAVTNAEGQGTEAAVVPMRTKTFDEVKDQIAREMATATALALVREKMDQAFSVMTIYSSELEGYRRAQEEKLKGFEMPVRPDLRVIADELGLDYGTTGLVDSNTVQLMPIGQSFVSQGMRAQPMPLRLYIDATQGPGAEFVPLTSDGGGSTGSRFAFWKTKVESSVVPSFETVKDQVVEVWKLQQAIKLAESKAKELATQVGTGNLVDALPSEDQKKLVVEPAPFTAMNPIYPQFMQIDEVSRVDPLLPVDGVFMDGVFSTKVGETVAVPDRRRSVFYVVKVLEMSPPNEELLTRFMTNPSETVNTLGYRDFQQARSSLFESLEKRLDFRLY
ncbi:MAG: hypothetical protein ACK5PB_14205 [Pirellula sp.]|jgi:hypothetical protein